MGHGREESKEREIGAQQRIRKRDGGSTEENKKINKAQQGEERNGS